MNWNDIKKYDRKQLLSLVPSGFHFHTRPWTHQIASLVASIANDGFLCALDLGTGKTKASIDWIRYIDDGQKDIKTLVVCLKPAIENFADEVKLHSNLKATCLVGPTKDRMKLLKEDSNFFVINFEGLRNMLSKKVLNKRTEKNQLSVDHQKLSIMMEAGGFRSLIIDESHLVKTPGTLNFKLMSKIAQKIPDRLLLTGTPFGNSLLDIWSQYFIVDFGETYGTSFSRYREAYFENKGYFGPDWKVTENGKKKITELLFSKAIRYEESEVDELPTKTFRTRKFRLTKEQRVKYEETKSMKHEVEIIDKEMDIFGNITKVGTGEMREAGGSRRYTGFRMISSGYWRDDEGSYHRFKENPKLDLLWEIIGDTIEYRKVVIFTEFIESQSLLSDFFRKKKIKFNNMSGSTKGPIADQWRQFQGDDSYRLMLANMRSGSASVNLFAANYCFHYELGGSALNYRQSVKRIHRGGQTRRCFLYNLIATQTVEVGMARNLKNDVDAFSGIMDHKAFIDGK